MAILSVTIVADLDLKAQVILGKGGVQAEVAIAHAAQHLQQNHTVKNRRDLM